MTGQLQDVGFETAGVLWALDPTLDTGYMPDATPAQVAAATLNFQSRLREHERQEASR